MGTVGQTPHRGNHKTGRGEKEGQGKGVAWETDTKKNLRPRKVIERNTEKRGAPEDSKGTARRGQTRTEGI